MKTKTVIKIIVIVVFFWLFSSQSAWAQMCTGACCAPGLGRGTYYPSEDYLCTNAGLTGYGCYDSCASAPSAPGPGQKALGQLGGDDGFGPWGNLDLSSIAAPAAAFAKIISNLIGIMTIIAGIWFLIQFILAAVSIIGASGDPKKMESATGKIRTAIIGLVVTVAAYALISLLGGILGFEFLNIASLIEKLSP
ncbi:hypothetical protein COT66_02080 [Candidatus Shapirobacteria bacterium CG09_land_8_20_14_0_10_49_15]|uniref:DUF4190 domain-containing protein n=1 Tax=Candidatus Shapirobacteria bacterium CG09_land_8_20_14_0_10_49_15 TaxID=1974482 RepID=A0A2M6XAJ9_9BACT|nr:MAG: hypothetical protein COT66_02080 [Candidatus Shapirobacteria bacterium CG09_land_8_20_14_0_10_49_15]